MMVVVVVVGGMSRDMEYVPPFLVDLDDLKEFMTAAVVSVDEDMFNCVDWLGGWFYSGSTLVGLFYTEISHFFS